MKTDTPFIQISNILNIINSCETKKQLKSCLNIINNYIKLLSKKGVLNYHEVEQRLIKKYKQKEFSISVLKLHIKQNIQEFQLLNEIS
jgi:hypothetical protein